MFKVIDHTDCFILDIFDDFDSACKFAIDFSCAHRSHCLEVSKVGSTLGLFVMDGEYH